MSFLKKFAKEETNGLVQSETQVIIQETYTTRFKGLRPVRLLSYPSKELIDSFFSIDKAKEYARGKGWKVIKVERTDKEYPTKRYER